MHCSYVTTLRPDHFFMVMHCSNVYICLGEHVSAQFPPFEEVFIMKPSSMTICTMGTIQREQLTQIFFLVLVFDCGFSCIKLSLAINAQFSLGSTL